MAKRISKKKQAEGIASRITPAPAGSQPTTIRQRMGDAYPSSPARGKEAGAIKAAQTREATSTAKVSRTGANPVGSNPLGSQPMKPPTTGSWGLPRDPVKFARLTRRPSTRGHMSTADHVRQLEASADMLGVGTNVSREVRGEIRGLSKDSPVVPPHPTMIGRGENRRQVMYTNEYDRQAPMYTGGDISAGDFERWGVGGRPDILDVKQSHQRITVPGFDRGDRRPGSSGEFSGMSPDALETAVKAEVIPERINRQVSRLMRPGTVHRAPGIAKPYGLAGGGLTPAQKEMTDTVTVSKGGRTRTMTQAQHQERAEKQIAKRTKVEKTEEES
jgi:hypothetical protein